MVRYAGGGRDRGPQARIANSEFSYNKAPNGGAIWFAGGELDIHGTKLHHNAATNIGGALAVAKGPRGDVKITLRHVTFERNEAPVGGAVDLEHDADRPPSMNGIAVSFLENTATRARRWHQCPQRRYPTLTRILRR